jgi:uncharacterized protein YndB with AHSA1/START domain
MDARKESEPIPMKNPTTTISFLSCEADVRTGGTYRFVFGHPAAAKPMEFFGRYIEVTPHSRLVWTNDEGAEGGAVTTVINHASPRADRVRGTHRPQRAQKNAFPHTMGRG